MWLLKTSSERKPARGGMPEQCATDDVEDVSTRNGINLSDRRRNADRSSEILQIFDDGGAQNSLFRFNQTQQGGAIFIDHRGTVQIHSNNYEFTDNSATQDGGAIFNSGGTLTIQRGRQPQVQRVLVRHNTAQAGAGIYNFGGNLTIDGAEFTQNVSRGADGGGELAVVSAAPTVSHSWFHQNATAGHGTSIYATRGSSLSVSASTFADEIAVADQNAGIYADTFSSLNVVNSTFLGEEKRESIFVSSGSGQVVNSTIVSGRFIGAQGANISLRNSVVWDVICQNALDGKQNLQFQSSGCPTSIPRTNPKLDPNLLHNNGGPTLTIALTPGSPAIDAIPVGSCTDFASNPVSSDQRGFGRPDPSNPRFCDIGAFEFGAVMGASGIGGIPKNPPTP